jgi:hypothetical protein
LQLVSIRALTAANQPLKKSSQNAATQLLAQARKKSIPPIPEVSVEQAGSSFIDASSPADPGAWGVALDFVSYRSSLNEAPNGPFELVSLDSIPTTLYQLQGIAVGTNKKPVPKMYYRGFTRQAEAARAEFLLEPIHQKSERGMSMFVMKGEAIDISSMWLRHCTLENVDVYYLGGDTRLEDVRFVNCRFFLEDSPAGRSLASAVLTNTQVNLLTPLKQ